MGEATEEERAALIRWRSSRPANDVEFRRQQYVWDRLGEFALAGGGSAPVMPKGRRASGPNGDTVVHRIRPDRGENRHLAWTALVAAACLFAVLVRWSPMPSPGPALGAEDVVTGADEVVTLTLRDGTVVRLGPQSRLSFSEVEGPRDVLLEGKAYFAVRRVPDSVFRVHTHAGSVKVLGTRFEVEAREGGVQIVVVEGEVEAALPESSLSIRGGQMGRIEESAPPLLAPVENVYLATAWIGEFGAFESTPLSDVVAELEARFGLDIEVTDEVLAKRTVSGLFINQAPDEMVASICLAVNAWCSRSGETIRMWQPQAAPGASRVVPPDEAPTFARRASRTYRDWSPPT